MGSPRCTDSLWGGIFRWNRSPRTRCSILSDFVTVHLDDTAFKVCWVRWCLFLMFLSTFSQIAETCWGCNHTSSSAKCQRWLPRDLPQASYGSRISCSCRKATSRGNDEHRHSTPGTKPHRWTQCAHSVARKFQPFSWRKTHEKKRKTISEMQGKNRGICTTCNWMRCTAKETLRIIPCENGLLSFVSIKDVELGPT